MLTHYYLENGLEVVIKPNHFANMIAVQCWVRAGSLHEAEHEKGMAHVLEHMLFKGTEKREVGVISSTVEACGGDMNAYTTFDRTVYYLTMSSQHSELAIELLADAILHSSFDASELEREKEVIIEEIRRGNDSPSSRVGHKMFEHMFAGTEAQRPIIGYEESVRSFSRQDLVQFHRKWYTPKNMSVVVVGNFENNEVQAWVEKYFGSTVSREVPSIDIGKITPLQKSSAHLLRGDFQQPRLELCWQIPGEEHPDAIALDLAAFALGSGETSRFVRVLRNEKSAVVDAHAGVYAPYFGGMFEVSIQTTKELYLTSIEETAFEIAKMIYQEPIHEIELERARANLRASRIYNDETVSGQARVLGYGLTTRHKLMFDDVVTALVEKTPSSLVQEAVKRSLNLDHVVLVGLVHHDWELTDAQMLEAYQRGVTKAKAMASIKSKIVTKKEVSKKEDLLNPVTLTLKNGMKLIYRQNPDAKLFSMVAVTHGGLRCENEKEAGFFNACSGMLGMATKQKSYDELSAFVEDHGAMVEGFSGKDSVGMKLHCLSEQQAEFQTLMLQMIRDASFPETQWQSVQRDIVEEIKTQDDSPSGMAIRKFQQLVYGDHPYRYTVNGLEKNVLSWKAQDLEKRWRQWSEQQPWVIAATGSQPIDDLRLRIEEYTDSWKKVSFDKIDKSLAQKIPSTVSTKEAKLVKEREQTHIMMGFKGIDWYDSDRYALDIIAAILGGSGGRLFTKLRDQQSLAYSVSPIVSYGVHGGVVGAYIACSPSKVKQAKEGILAELRLLIDEKPEQKEFDRAVEYIVGNHEADMQRGDSQALTMGLMELYQIGGDDFLKYPSNIRRVRVEDVQSVAKRLFKFSSLITVEVGIE